MNRILYCLSFIYWRFFEIKIFKSNMQIFWYNVPAKINSRILTSIKTCFSTLRFVHTKSLVIRYYPIFKTLFKCINDRFIYYLIYNQSIMQLQKWCAKNITWLQLGLAQVFWITFMSRWIIYFATWRNHLHSIFL